MKIEIIKTLKGATVRKKGTVFDDAVAPIPGNILNEVRHGSRAVRVIEAEKPIAEIKTEIEIKEAVEEESVAWAKLPDADDLPQETTSSQAPPETEEFKCSNCRWVGKTEAALKRHNTMKHK